MMEGCGRKYNNPVGERLIYGKCIPATGTGGAGAGEACGFVVWRKGTALRYRRIVWWGSAGLILGLGTVLGAQEAAPPAGPAVGSSVFKDEPQARALYDKMVEAFRQSQTLSYKSDYRWEARGRELGHCTYTIWLKKPNYFRVEAASLDGARGGTIVGDGETLWLFWLGDRPFFSTEDKEAYDKTRSKVYMKEPAPPGHHSIGHRVGRLGAGMSMTILDPSMFHGYTDSLQPYLDGVMGMGEEQVGDEQCDVVEVSLMKHQRSWYLWLSRKDHLPRKLKEVVRVAHEIVTHEVWSDIVIGSDIAAEKFVWSPPEGWQPWQMPKLEDRLLKPGTPAPDFELTAVDGSKIKLSDFRDKIVWFCIWRAG
jgi:outer membrane lipoprotein-sorting protein